MSKNLSDAFGTPAAAAANLSGLLPPRQRPSRETQTEQRAAPEPPVRAPAKPATPSPEPESEREPRRSETPAAEKPVRSATPRRKLRAAPAMARKSQTFQVPVYVLPEVKVVAEQRRKEDRRITNAQIAFDAIDSTFEDLYHLLRDRRVIDRPRDSLFPARRAPRNRVAMNERRVLWAIQATADELEVLDKLIAELGAESRSDLIATAVEADLLPQSRR